MKNIFPLTTKFRADTFFHAFIINAFVAAVVAAVAIETRFDLEKEESGIYKFVKKIKGKTGGKLKNVDKLICVFVSAFITTFLIYGILYLLIDYGGGMMVEK